MKGKGYIFSLIVAGLLTGCGGGSGSSSGVDNTGGSGNTGGGNENTGQVMSITPWAMPTVLSKMTKVDVSAPYNATLDLCGYTGQVVETKDFQVGFNSSNTTFDTVELERVARLTQVALDEHISNTGLDLVSDLGIDSSTKWTVCYEDDASGNGQALFPNGFEFSPKSLDLNNADFESAYILAKHELFHVIQYSLLPEPSTGENHYSQYPRWISEASAEFFAGKQTLAPASVIKRFMADTGITPYSVNQWQEEQDLNTETSGAYANYMYRMYLASFNYLVDHGLSFNHLVRLIEASHDIAAFDAEMAVIENEMTLPSTYSQLKSSPAVYQTHVVNDWLNSLSNVASYTDDIPADVISIFFIDSDQKEWEASVNTEQDQYTLNVSIPDGAYEVYALTKNDEVYGPIALLADNGEFGSIDFTGVSICTSAFCTATD